MARAAKPWYRVGVGAWYVWHGGKQIPLARGPREATEAEAWKEFHRLLAREGKARPSNLTVLDAAELFLDYSQETHADGTYRAYRGALAPPRGQVRPRQGERP